MRGMNHRNIIMHEAVRIEEAYMITDMNPPQLFARALCA